MLSSDVLEAQFGPTTIDVLYQSDTERIIQTRVISTGKILELSWVKFDLSNIHKFAQAHKEVMAGESIGKVFRSRGIEFERIQAAAAKLLLPKYFNAQFQTKQPSTVVKVRVYVTSEKVHYCDILETYNPLIKWPEDTLGLSNNMKSSIDKFSLKLTNLYMEKT